jgi:hypothetical protein
MSEETQTQTQLTEQQVFAAIEAWREEIGCDYIGVSCGYEANGNRADIHVACFGGIDCNNLLTIAEAKAFVAAAKDKKTHLAKKLAEVDAQKADLERQLLELYAERPEDSQEPPAGSGSVSAMLEAGECNLTR